MRSRLIKGGIEKRFNTSLDSSLRIINYGDQNTYPQEAREAVKGSATGSMCLKKKTKFIVGQGFKEEAYNSLVVNRRGMTLLQLLDDISKDYAEFEGFAIHVHYDPMGRMVAIDSVDFEFCRLADPDDYGTISKIAVYDDWDKAKFKVTKKMEIEKIDMYNPDPEIVRQQIARDGDKYRGQILYFNGKDFRGQTYPECPHDGVLEEMKTEAMLSQFKLSISSNSFLPSTILKIANKLSDDEYEEIVADLKKIQGADNAGKVMILEDVDEISAENPMLEPFESKTDDAVFKYTESSCESKIRRHYRIPPVLVGEYIPGKLGAQKEMEEAYAIYNQETVYERDRIAYAIEAILPGIDATIKPLAFDSLEGIGRDNAEDVMLVLESTISDAQKRVILRDGYGLAEDTINELFDGAVNNQ